MLYVINESYDINITATPCNSILEEIYAAVGRNCSNFKVHLPIQRNSENIQPSNLVDGRLLSKYVTLTMKKGN